MTLFVPVIIVLLSGLGKAISQGDTQDEPKARIQKIYVLNVSAVDLVNSFGGSVVRDSLAWNGNAPGRRNPYGSGEASGFLPDPAPEAITALEVDNSIL